MDAIRRVELAPDRELAVGSMPQPTALEIRRVEAMWQGVHRTYFYLVSLDAEGNGIGETFHESLSNAEAQAEYQFGVSPDRWCAVQ
jgi:hypothetical protein